MTFKISKQTDLATLKAVACDFWGLNDKYFRLYTESAELVDTGSMSENTGGLAQAN
jgi:hypothetical protein